MIVGIHQPHYLPWLRYVHKIARSDVFVLLDDVQYSKNGWQNRNKIKGAQGWMYLTVPVKDAFGRLISDVGINNQERWREKHWNALRTNYARAPYFARYGDELGTVYAREWSMLGELALTMLDRLLSVLGVDTRIVRSSTLGIPGKGTERLVGICKALGATTYLTGDYAASNHLEVELFERAGIEVRLQAWRCPSYPQQHQQAGFIPDLSIVDLLFNAGPESLRLLTGSHANHVLSEIGLRASQAPT